jgi:hypothetical protein
MHLQQAVPGYTCSANNSTNICANTAASTTNTYAYRGSDTVDSATNVSTDCSANAVASTTNTLAYRGSDAVDSATDCSTDIGANAVAPAVPNVTALTSTNRNTDASNDTIPNRPADRNHCVLHGIA